MMIKNLLIALFLTTAFLLSDSVFAQNKSAKSNVLKTEIGGQATVEVNNISLRIRNNGQTGINGRGYYPAGSTNTFLFNGGLGVSGMVNGETRTASMILRPYTIKELRAGRLEDVPTDSIASFYTVSATDTFGSLNYLRWADAVATGADFQDLNNDGQYDPLLDRPDLLGDYTVWCVYSDDTPVDNRTPMMGTLPIGMDIQQTVWAYQQNDATGDILFFRYKLINRSPSNVDSLMFTVWTDPDIGEWDDDMIGSSIEKQTAYVYNDGADAIYGSNPPVFGVRFLQGPIIDSPGEVAYDYRGDFFGTDSFHNKRNVAMSALLYIEHDTPIIPLPFFAQNFRYFQQGCRTLTGEHFDPTRFGVGATDSTDCHFVFNGDPVTATGWRDDFAFDKHMYASSGYFDLAIADTQTVIIAYLVGRGTDALDSITEMHARGDLAESILGFSNYPVGIEPLQESRIADFELLQNYPNPFNPTTAIRYRLAKSANVKLQVFNLAGQKILTLVDGPKVAAEHQVEFNAAYLPTGMYFYRLTVGSESITRKMLLLR